MMIINSNAVTERCGLPAEALSLSLSDLYSMVLKYLSIILFKFSSQSFPGKELTHGTPVGMTLSSPIIFSLSFLQFRALASFAKKINREINNNLVITQ